MPVSSTPYCSPFWHSVNQEDGTPGRQGWYSYWDRRLWTEGDFWSRINYIWWNPVKHGHVARVQDWPYSSFHRYVKQGFYPLDWAGGDDANDAAGDDYGELQ